MKGSSWTDDRRRLLGRRLRSLHLYDALISPQDWAVYLIGDMWMKPLYVISKMGIEVARRRRLDSTLEYLLENNAPGDLDLVPDGALHFLEDDVGAPVHTPQFHMLPVPTAKLPIPAEKGGVRPLVSAYFDKIDSWPWIDLVLV